MLESTIKPDLERLRADKVEFLAWQSACSKSEQLGHIVAAHNYWEALQLCKRVEADQEHWRGKIQELEEYQGTLKVPSLSLRSSRRVDASQSHALSTLCRAPAHDCVCARRKSMRVQLEQDISNVRMICSATSRHKRT